MRKAGTEMHERKCYRPQKFSLLLTIIHFVTGRRGGQDATEPGDIALR